MRSDLPTAAILPEPAEPRLDLAAHGLINASRVFANLSPAALTELALLRGEGLLSDRGALVTYTGARTGRSPRDRFLVADPACADQIWWGPINRPIEPVVESAQSH